MSLQVWLPLNGDLHNQGLNSLNQVNIQSGCILDNNGKIGKCYTNTETNNSVITNCNFSATKFSMCAWIKINESTGGWHCPVKFNDANFTFGLGCEHTNGTSLGFHCYKYINGTGTSVFDTYAASVEIGVWVHYAIVYDGLKYYIYKNGSLLSSGNANLTNIEFNCTRLFLFGGSTSYTSKSSINDVRIYDHALSAKEVEEISKGLVLHYKLDKQYTSIPSKNLFISSGFTSTDYTNMTTSSDTSNWSKYLRWYNGSKAIHSFSDGADTIKLNNTGNLGIAFVRKATDINLDPDSYYTLSCEAKCTKSGAQLGIGTSYYTTANAWVWRGGANKFTFAATNTWQTFTYTFKPDSNTQYICYCFTCANGVSGGTDTFSIRHCQLEKGSTATDWVLNNADIDYKGNEIDDCSGYNNNGTLIGSLATETSSPKYTVYTHFPATTTKIHILDFLTSGFDNSYSFAWWGKRNANNTMFWGFLDGIRLNGMFNGNLWNTGDSSNNPLYKIGTTTQVTAPSLNQWHHYVMTGDGTKCYVYLDGELWAEAKTYKTISGTSIYINGWDNTTSYSSNNMDISDFRIYATALTSTQIKELYNTSATIDNQKNIYARELVEIE